MKSNRNLTPIKPTDKCFRTKILKISKGGDNKFGLWTVQSINQSHDDFQNMLISRFERNAHQYL